MPPALAIVLVTDAASRLDKVLRCHRADGDPARREIVVVALGGARVDPAAIAALGFPHVQVLTHPGHDIAGAEARAAHAATAPWIVFAQAHGHPRPGYADAVLAAAREGTWAAIGPAIENANPESATSWAGAAVHHGSWAHRRPRGPSARIPGHHSAYERAALLVLEPALADVLPAGPALHAALRARGGRLLLEPAACVDVVNISRLRSFLHDQLLQAAAFARRRRRAGLSTPRRLLYAAGSPLIPALWLRHIVRNLRRDGRLGELPRGLPVLLAGLVMTAVGEGIGYLVDWDVDRTPRRAAMALDRIGHLSPADRRRELDARTWPRVASAEPGR